MRDCPCERNCPEGCVDCENEICKRARFLTVIGDQAFAPRTQYNLAIDGSEKIEIVTQTPEVSGRIGYLKDAGHAILKDELFIFGGSSDLKKVPIN